MTAVRDTSGELLGFGKVTRDVTERMQAQEALRKEMAEKAKAQWKLSESEESLRRLSIHLLRTQDEERRRIGRELHDTLGQYLIALKMKLDSLVSEEPNPRTRISIELAQCSTWIAECVKEVRTISYLLYPPMLEERGLKSAIPWYLDGFTDAVESKSILRFPVISNAYRAMWSCAVSSSPRGADKHSSAFRQRKGGYSPIPGNRLSFWK